MVSNIKQLTKMSKPVDTIKGKTLDLLFCLPIHLLFVNKVREYIVMNGINQQRHSVTRLTFRTVESNYKTTWLFILHGFGPSRVG